MMEKISIEKRARKFAAQYPNHHKAIKHTYIVAATEQDRIARADEREMCLNAICRTCQDLIFCVDRNCMYINNIRKAIEEGGKQ